MYTLNGTVWYLFCLDWSRISCFRDENVSHKYTDLTPFPFPPSLGFLSKDSCLRISDKVLNMFELTLLLSTWNTLLGLIPSYNTSTCMSNYYYTCMCNHIVMSDQHRMLWPRKLKAHTNTHSTQWNNCAMWFNQVCITTTIGQKLWVHQLESLIAFYAFLLHETEVVSCKVA